MKRAVLSGGAGFIGSHLAEELLDRGYRVTVIDNLSTGRIENLKGLKTARLKIVRRDVNDIKHILPYFRKGDLVFHLAALADIVPSVQRPLEYHRANVDGTISMLECARLTGARKFVYAASSSCYGIPDIFPTPETTPISPEYPYAFTKYAGESYVRHWGKVYGMPYVSLRLFNVYGPRSRTSGTYGAVFGVFLAQKLAGRPFTVVGDGTQKRDFVFVKDVARAFRMAAESGVKNDVFNVGTGRPRSVNELVGLLGGDKVYIPKRPGEPDLTHADIRKITRGLKWKPETSFDKGVSIMLENISYWDRAPVWTPSSIKKTTVDWFKYLSKKG